MIGKKSAAQANGSEDISRQREREKGSAPVTTGRATGASELLAEQRVTELTNDLQRTRADFENYRKQMDLQKSQAATHARQETVSKFLPLLDDLDRAISSTPDLKPLEKNLEKTVKDLGLEKINSAAGVDFNPDFHDAVMMEDSDGDKQVVAEELRSGYLYSGSVLRPAMVKVKNV